MNLFQSELEAQAQLGRGERHASPARRASAPTPTRRASSPGSPRYPASPVPLQSPSIALASSSSHPQRFVGRLEAVALAVACIALMVVWLMPGSTPEASMTEDQLEEFSVGLSQVDDLFSNVPMSALADMSHRTAASSVTEEEPNSADIVASDLPSLASLVQPLTPDFASDGLAEAPDIPVVAASAAPDAEVPSFDQNTFEHDVGESIFLESLVAQPSASIMTPSPEDSPELALPVAEVGSEASDAAYHYVGYTALLGFFAVGLICAVAARFRLLRKTSVVSSQDNLAPDPAGVLDGDSSQPRRQRQKWAQGVLVVSSEAASASSVGSSNHPGNDVASVPSEPEAEVRRGRAQSPSQRRRVRIIDAESEAEPHVRSSDGIGEKPDAERMDLVDLVAPKMTPRRSRSRAATPEQTQPYKARKMYLASPGKPRGSDVQPYPFKSPRLREVAECEVARVVASDAEVREDEVRTRSASGGG